MRDEPEQVDRKGIIYGRHAEVKREMALRMRRKMTPAEALLWERLRASRLDNLHFRRQQVIDGLIADFYCHSAGLVLECDGPIHERQRERDEDRDAILKARGLAILRFTNDDIENNMVQVLRAIATLAFERRAILNRETAPQTPETPSPPGRGWRA
jgi:very-short-patch-repair endonuclease